MDILLIGLSYKTAPIEIRERLATPPDRFFDANLSPEADPEINPQEVVLLSTCNRLELYAVVHNHKAATQTIINHLARVCQVSPALFMPYLYIRHNDEAVAHLMRVAAGLDSMVIGEPQILGQVTQAYESALDHQATGVILSALFRAAIQAGKEARSQTQIGANSVSVSAVAANLATQMFDSLSGRRALLIGAGEMGAITMRALMSRGLGDVEVANRTYQKALDLARAWGGKAVAFERLTGALAAADIVITSTSAPAVIIDKEMLIEVMRQRQNRPLYIVDIAVPRDVAPDATDIPNLYLHDIDDLQHQADENALEREAEVPKVEKIIIAAQQRFQDWLAAQDATSTISTLRQQIEQLRQQELQRIFNRLDLDEREQNLVATMSHRLVNKILHEPTLRLKQETANGNGTAYITTMRTLFALDGDGLCRN